MNKIRFVGALLALFAGQAQAMNLPSESFLSLLPQGEFAALPADLNDALFNALGQTAASAAINPYIAAGSMIPLAPMLSRKIYKSGIIGKTIEQSKKHPFITTAIVSALASRNAEIVGKTTATLAKNGALVSKNIASQVGSYLLEKIVDNPYMAAAIVGTTGLTGYTFYKTNLRQQQRAEYEQHKQELLAAVDTLNCAKAEQLTTELNNANIAAAVINFIETMKQLNGQQKSAESLASFINKYLDKNEELTITTMNKYQEVLELYPALQQVVKAAAYVQEVVNNTTIDTTFDKLFDTLFNAKKISKQADTQLQQESSGKELPTKEAIKQELLAALDTLNIARAQELAQMFNDNDITDAVNDFYQASTGLNKNMQFILDKLNGKEITMTNIKTIVQDKSYPVTLYPIIKAFDSVQQKINCTAELEEQLGDDLD